MLIDTHAHLRDRRFADDVARSDADLLAAARAAGVGQLIDIACRREEWPAALAFAAQQDGRVGVAVGIHPCAVKDETLVEVQELVRLVKTYPQVVAFGETGLDYHYETESKMAQAESFRRHMTAAAEVQVPVVVHTRDAEQDTLAMLAERPKGAEFVLHCFSGTRMLAEEGVRLGGYVSFSGILTFKNSKEMREIAAGLPRERVLVETDAPYLAPEPQRGKRNEPALVVHTARVLAEVWQVSPEEVAKVTTANARRLFGRLAAL